MFLQRLINMRNDRSQAEIRNRRVLTRRDNLQLASKVFRHADNDVFAFAEGITPALTCSQTAPSTHTLLVLLMLPRPYVHGLPTLCKDQLVELCYFMRCFGIKGFIFTHRQTSRSRPLHRYTVTDHHLCQPECVTGDDCLTRFTGIIIFGIRRGAIQDDKSGEFLVDSASTAFRKSMIS